MAGNDSDERRLPRLRFGLVCGPRLRFGLVWRRRRGMAVLLVLGVLAVTLAVCYATLRGQGTTTQLARNQSRALQAREAAKSGLAAALRKMAESNWAGVGAPLSANVTPDSWYEVTFSVGDTALTARNE